MPDPTTPEARARAGPGAREGGAPVTILAGAGPKDKPGKAKKSGGVKRTGAADSGGIKRTGSSGGGKRVSNLVKASGAFARVLSK